MDDFAVFVNDYLTPDQLSIQEYSCASDQQEFSLLVTIDAESLTMKVRLRDQELMFQVTGLEMVVIGLSESLYCLVDGSFNERGKHFSYLFEDKSVRSEGWVLDLEMLKKKHL